MNENPTQKSALLTPKQVGEMVAKSIDKAAEDLSPTEKEQLIHVIQNWLGGFPPR